MECMEGLRNVFAFIRRRYFSIIVFSALANGVLFLTMSPYVAVFLPLAFLYLASKMLRLYRESQGRAHGPKPAVFSSVRGMLRNSVLMFGMYAIALGPAALTFYALREYGNPLPFFVTELPFDFDLVSNFEAILQINNMIVAALPFLIVISIFTFIPYVIADASEDASISFIVKKALRLIRRSYLPVFLIRVLASVRYIGHVLVLMIPMMLIATVMGDDGGAMAYEFFRFNSVVILVVFFVMVPLYHGFMVSVYEKAKQDDLAVSSHRSTHDPSVQHPSARPRERTETVRDVPGKQHNRLRSALYTFVFYRFVYLMLALFLGFFITQPYYQREARPEGLSYVIFFLGFLLLAVAVYHYVRGVIGDGATADPARRGMLFKFHAALLIGVIHTPYLLTRLSPLQSFVSRFLGEAGGVGYDDGSIYYFFVPRLILTLLVMGYMIWFADRSLRPESNKERLQVGVMVAIIPFALITYVAYLYWESIVERFQESSLLFPIDGLVTFGVFFSQIVLAILFLRYYNRRVVR